MPGGRPEGSEVVRRIQPANGASHRGVGVHVRPEEAEDDQLRRPGVHDLDAARSPPRARRTARRAPARRRAPPARRWCRCRARPAGCRRRGRRAVYRAARPDDELLAAELAVAVEDPRLVAAGLRGPGDRLRRGGPVLEEERVAVELPVDEAQREALAVRRRSAGRTSLNSRSLEMIRPALSAWNIDRTSESSCSSSVSAVPGACSTPDGIVEALVGDLLLAPRVPEDQVAVPVHEVGQQHVAAPAARPPTGARRRTTPGAAPCRRRPGTSRPRPWRGSRPGRRTPAAGARGTAAGRRSRTAWPAGRAPPGAPRRTPRPSPRPGRPRPRRAAAAARRRSAHEVAEALVVRADPVVRLRRRAEPPLADRSRARPRRRRPRAGRAAGRAGGSPAPPRSAPAAGRRLTPASIRSSSRVTAHSALEPAHRDALDEAAAGRSMKTTTIGSVAITEPAISSPTTSGSSPRTAPGPAARCRGPGC